MVVLVEAVATTVGLSVLGLTLVVGLGFVLLAGLLVDVAVVAGLLELSAAGVDVCSETVG